MTDQQTAHILATGGAGYIGSHVATSLMAAGYDVTILDDFSNAHPQVIERINALSNRRVSVVEGDVRDGDFLDRVFAETKIDGVIHLAGLKAVAESVADPARYYDVNVGGAVALMQGMQRAEVKRLVFSSSATVYGDPDHSPVPEDAPLRPVNPYGRSKLMVERILTDAAAADPDAQFISLRYFNPVGAHPSGTIGDDPLGIPNNLFPLLAQTAVGRRPEIQIFGDDWATPDGTGVRDYIHVMDLAEGHVAALDHLMGGGAMGQNLAVNLGTGRGVSVQEAVDAFGVAVGDAIPSRVVGRRPGDLPCYYGDPALAERLFGWRATRDLAQICRDHWAWQSANPQGYASD